MLRLARSIYVAGRDGHSQFIEGGNAKAVRVTFAGFSDLDDLPGHEFGDRVLPTGQLKYFQRAFVGRRQAFNGFGLKHPFLENPMQPAQPKLARGALCVSSQ